jgi:hypothetical protein
MKAPFEPAWYQGLRLAEKYLDRMGQNPAFSEQKSWKQKIPKRLRDTLPMGFRESQPTGERSSQSTNLHEAHPTSPTRTPPMSLHVSQAVVVARGIIFAQVMWKLPQPKKFVPTEESRRFSWLLQVSSEDVWTIHGGCGVSPKLLHVMS